MPNSKLVLLTAIVLGYCMQTAEAADPAPSCAGSAESACAENFKDEASQCDRYYLQRTEANRLCHESAKQRRSICYQRAARECGERTTEGLPGS